MKTIYFVRGEILSLPLSSFLLRGHFVRIPWYQKLILKAHEVRCIKRQKKKKRNKRTNHELRGILLQIDMLNFNVVAQ
jgi:hypothetical protein